MLETLRIENIALLEEAELDFAAGLNVLTGETGAGKSIVLGALSLLAGARASADRLREGAPEGAVEGIFSLEGRSELVGVLRHLDLRPQDDEEDEKILELLVRRSLTASGRSRARVDGKLVPLATLAELFAGRVEISSQHSSQALRKLESQGQMLDAVGGLLALRALVGQHFAAIRQLDAEALALSADEEERERRRDYLVFQLEELDGVDLQPGELESLAASHARLAHGEALREESFVALAAILGEEGDNSLGTRVVGAQDAIALTVRSLESMVQRDPEVDPMRTRLGNLELELKEFALDLERYRDGLESDPGRLARVEERMAETEKLRRKYGKAEQEIFAERERLAAELAQLAGADRRLTDLAGERAQRVAQLGEAAERLSAGRRKAARKLIRVVEGDLHELAMPDAHFGVEFEKVGKRFNLPTGVTSGARGAEVPEFLLSANAGESLRPLAKVASGGELSRCFLALTNALRESGEAKVLVFDEVDAGIGGEAAERVGAALLELSRFHQVLCITHLPQLAVFADRHFKVGKRKVGGRTRVQIEALDVAGQVEEIARMAGGEKISAATRRHAKALLSSAARRK